MKEIIKRLIPVEVRLRIIAFLFRICVVPFSLLPAKNRVLFYSIRDNNRLLENSRAVWDALDCEKIMFAHKLPHSFGQSLKACFLLRTSKIIVTDDYCKYMRLMKLGKKQKLFQIWHGCGAFKSFGLDAPSLLTKEQERKTHARYDAVAVTGEGCRKYFAGAFGVSEEICLPVGLPGTDYLVNNGDELRDDMLDRHPELRGKTVYLYCPTFREKDGVKTNFNPGIDWEKLSGSLKEDELFIVSRHPLMDYELIEGRFDNVFDMTEESTLSLAAVSSVLVTDYSSTVHDAVLLGVPVVFYCPDCADYERKFYLNFPDDLPGDMIMNSGELIDAVRRTKENPPTAKIERFRSEQLSACDGHSTERVRDIIYGWLK